MNTISRMLFLHLLVLCFLFPLGGQAKQTDQSCDNAGKSFDKLKAEMATTQPHIIECRTTTGSKIDISTKFQKGICKTIYSKIKDGIAKFNSNQKAGCVNIQKNLSEASACSSLKGASQQACFTQAGMSFTSAALSERNSIAGLDPYITDLNTLTQEADQAQNNYRNDSRQMAAKNYSSGIGGETVVPLANGNASTLHDYRDRIPNLIEETFTAKNFAEKFVVAANATKTEALARATEWENEAKKMKGVMSNGDPSAPPPASAASGNGGSGISMPSMGGGSEKSGESEKSSKISSGSVQKKSASPGFITAAPPTKDATIFTAIKSILSKPENEDRVSVSTGTIDADETNVNRIPSSANENSKNNSESVDSGISSTSTTNGADQGKDSNTSAKQASAKEKNEELHSPMEEGSGAREPSGNPQDEASADAKEDAPTIPDESMIESQFSESEKNLAETDAIEGPLESLFYRITNKLESAQRRGLIKRPNKSN